MQATSRGEFVGLIAMDEHTAAEFRKPESEINPDCDQGSLAGHVIITTFGGHDYIKPTFPGYCLIEENYRATGSDAADVLLRLIKNRRQSFGKQIAADLSRKSAVTAEFTLLSDRRFRERLALKPRLRAELAKTDVYQRMTRTKEDEELEDLVVRFRRLLEEEGTA